MPVTVLCMLECHAEHLQPILQLHVSDVPGSEEVRRKKAEEEQGAALAAPADPGPVLAGPAESGPALAGPLGPDRIKYTQPLWLSTGIRARCAVLARTTRAQGIAVIDEWLSESKPQSRLLCVQIRWTEPVDGNEFHIIVTGHLHNSAAKKAGQGRSEFCDRLLGYCARGARFLALDANMAMYGMISLMAARGVQLTLLAAHWEVGEDDTALFDSMGIWAVGPIDLSATKVLTPKTHAIAGAHHPCCEDATHQYVNRGFSVKSHAFPLPGHLHEGPALAGPTGTIRAHMVTTPANLMEEVAGCKAWAPVRATEPEDLERKAAAERC
ncbi:MAG: hypothetical protein GY772_01380, partial [bacterium]|nr:hypothetical protein [bacterium]